MMSENVDVGYAKSISELCERVRGELKAEVKGETWNYAIIVNEKAVILTKYSPRSKNLYLRGLIAISKEDINSVVRELENVSKEVVKELLKKLAERYGVEIAIR